MNQFLEYRTKYLNFIYQRYDIKKLNDKILLAFDFEIVGLIHFHPTIEIPNNDFNIDDELFRYLVFHIGLIEAISYFKCTCSPNIIIEAGYLNNEQIKWFKKLYYYGLGEFLYLNNINISIDDFVNIKCMVKKKKINIPEYYGSGNLIPVGGGKDSCVTLDLLKQLDNHAFIINPKNVTLSCVEASGLNNKSICVKRVIDQKLLDLNKMGYLNGHTPFSSLVAFISYLVSYMYKKRYIVLSNEASANEATVIGTKINHQYSKSFEFEKDFNDYTKKYFGIEITYFSLLRPLSELQIGLLFSKLKKYHKIFKSCNVGSKNKEWNWCCNCPKCLFVYIILRVFLNEDEMMHIFGCDLLDKESLLPTFLELLGFSDTKPFECVGEYKEVRYAVSLIIKKSDHLPYLLKYYKEHYDLVEESYLDCFNDENNVPKMFIDILRSELKNAREDN